MLGGIVQLTRCPPGQSADGGAGNGNFQIAAPVLALPGRGISLALALGYNSRLWSKSGTKMTYDIDHGWPGPGWSLGFGKIQAFGTFTGSMVVDADGTRHGFDGDITINGGSAQTSTDFLGHTTDGSFIDYGHHTGVGGSLTSAWAKLPNGTMIDYAVAATAEGAMYPSRITDASGNYITITYRNNQGPQIETITDTLGRDVTFQYDSLERLISIKAPKMGSSNPNTRTLVRLHYKTLTLNHGFASGYTATVRNSTPYVLDAIYYPATNTGYWFGDTDSYSSYGMITKVLEQRGMTWSSGTEEQGVVAKGTTTSQSVYNYPAQADNSLTDAPTYTSLTETWDGMDTSAAVTTYEVHENDNPRTVTVTQPNGTRNKQYSYNRTGQTDPWDDGLVYLDQTYDVNNTLLGSSTVTWQKGAYDSPRPTRTEITDERGQLTASEFSYGSVFNQVTSARDYDYGGVNLLRETRTIYENSLNYTGQVDSVHSTYPGRHIFNLPTVAEVYNPDGSRATRTEYVYDGAALANTPGVIMYNQTFNPSTTETCACGACIEWEYDGSGHPYCVDRAQISVYNSATAYRGNVTSVKTYADAINLTGAITETRSYDVTGNLITASTSCCQQTSISYTQATQYAYPMSKTRGSADPNSPARVTSSADYNFETGLTTQSTDSNGRTATTDYDQYTLRPTRSTSATGAHVDYAYDDAAMTITEIVYTSDNIIASKNTKNLNGLGQVKHEEALGASSIWDVAETKYTKLGQVWQQTRPYRAGDTPQWAVTTYDALGRAVSVQEPDGTTSQAFYNESSRPGSASTLPGQTTRSRDAWGRERWGRSDALGRLVELVEPNPGGSGSVMDSGSLATTYAYTTLGSLTDAWQGAQHRSFKYDSLSRLLRQKLAEQTATIDDSGTYVGAGGTGAQWSEAFAYDSRSNLVQRTDPRGVIRRYSYQVSGVDDPLNRLQSASYDLSGPHDTSQPIAAAAGVSYEYMTTGDVTRLKKVTAAGVSTEEYTYDSESRVSDYTLTMLSRISYPFVTSYIYDSLDRVTDVRYPAQYGMVNAPRKVVHQTYDAASRLTQLTVDGAVQASGITYNAASQTTALLVGAGGANQIAESYSYDAQTGLLANQKVLRGTVSLLDLSYGYQRVGSSGRTGQLTQITNNLDRNKDRAYEYDALGRLAKVTGGVDAAWSQNYSYDRYGNRTGVAVTGVSAFRPAAQAAVTPPPVSIASTLKPAGTPGEPGGGPAMPERITAPTGRLDQPSIQSAAEPLAAPDQPERAHAVSNSPAEPNPVTRPFTTAHTPFDFDGDNKADVSSWRRSTGVWSILKSGNGSTVTATLGAAGDQIVPGDYDGDGKYDYATWRPSNGNWTVQRSSDSGTTTTAWGQAGDVPVAADYDGDGLTDYAVWRASTGMFYVLKSSNGGLLVQQLGGQQFGDIAAAADYDGDGKADCAVWRPSNGYWYIVQSSNNQLRQQQWGQAGDVPVPADYDGDGKADCSVWRPSGGVWYLLNSSDGNYLAPVLGLEASGDITVPADYDGDHRADVAMWRPSTGTWTIKRSLDGVTVTPQQGASGDVAVPSAYIRRSSAPANQGAPIVRDGLANVSYDAQTNRITTSGFQYDGAGNQTRILAQDGTSWQRMEYDAANRLVKVKDDAGNTVQNFTYGATNARLISQDGNEQSNNRTYYVSAGSWVVAEYVESSGAPTIPAWSKSYFYLGGRLLSTFAPAGGSEINQFHHPDRLGTRLISNAADTNVVEQVSLPFGTSLANESTGASNRRFTSYDRSAVTGLDYAVNRHYDSQQGRFTQADPIGMSATSLADPQSLNLFSYCANDPINRLDPSGLFWGKLFKWVSKALKWIGIAVTIAVMVLSLVVVPGGQGILAAIFTKLTAFLAKFGSILHFASGGLIVGGEAAALSGLQGLRVLGAIGAVADFISGDQKKQPKKDKAITRAAVNIRAILSGTNPCSTFFGPNATTALDALEKILTPGYAKEGPGNTELGIIQSGQQINYESPTKYRTYQDAVVNKKGPFYNRLPKNRIGGYPNGSNQTQALQILHELAHLVYKDGATLILDDAGPTKKVEPSVNTDIILQHCREQIDKIKN